jgi:ATP-dependent DNA helicase RecG
VEKGVEKLSRKQRIIIDLIKQNPAISKKMIEKKADLSKKSVEYNIKKLKKMGLLKRVGPSKRGHWEIINSDT